ncbi:MAG: DUF2764 family protein [Ruminococcaceae bacterium]|nr:DUF2764 family protein [Oscillospiraceae bacterium]
MNQYYLMAQLPSLDGLGETAPLPITEETFFDICSRSLSEAGMARLRSVTLSPDRDVQPEGSALLDAWNQGERQLRLALGALRAARMKKSFDPGEETPPPAVMQAARTAMSMEDPLAAERYLNQYRMSFLDQLRPMDHFSEDSVFYYILKLKLHLRMRRFDVQRGQAAYRNIYDSILHEDNQEDK